VRFARVLLVLAVLVAAIASCMPIATAEAAVTVTLRIEGSTQTLFEGPVTTEAHEVDGNDGTGPHPCWGGLGATPGPTATTALDDGARSVGLPWRGNWNPSFYDFFVESIGPDSSMPPEGYWGILVDGVSAGGGCTTKVKAGDEVLWAYGAVFKPLVLKLSGPSAAEVGKAFTVTVTAAGRPVANATVGGATTDAAGQASIVGFVATRLKLKAERSDAIRSNALEVCVGVEVGCQETASATTPSLTIGKIEPGETFAEGAGPRILRGEARGVSAVSLRLTTPHRAAREFAPAVSGGSWSVSIGRLRPGRYELRASAPGGLAASSVTFRVLDRKASAGALLERGLHYLRSAQHAGGGLGVAVGQAPSLAMTGWAAMVLGRGGPRESASAASRYLGRELKANDPVADQVRSAFAVAAAGTDPGLASRLCRRLSRRHGAGGSFGSDVDSTALAVLALGDVGCSRPVLDRAARRLRAQRNPDGGFGYRAGTPSDVDTTGLAIWALAAVRRTRASARASIAYLRSAQNYDGGFGPSPGSPSNSQSTGLAVAGLRAIGVPPTKLRTEDGIDPVDYLTTLQRGPGAIRYSRQGRQTPVWATSQALLGFGRGPFLPAG